MKSRDDRRGSYFGRVEAQANRDRVAGRARGVGDRRAAEHDVRRLLDLRRNALERTAVAQRRRDVARDLLKAVDEVLGREHAKDDAVGDGAWRLGLEGED